jgi:acetylornithine deacetylase/succinyl-diaminopimelate desuccinylase-like protein
MRADGQSASLRGRAGARRGAFGAIPCDGSCAEFVGRLSHNEAEEITPEWAEKGANVLLHAVLETAGVVA